MADSIEKINKDLLNPLENALKKMNEVIEIKTKSFKETKQELSTLRGQAKVLATQIKRIKEGPRKFVKKDKKELPSAGEVIAATTA